MAHLHDKLFAKDTHGNCFNRNLTVGESCEFACKSNYTVVGSKAISCKKSVGAIGKWMDANGNDFIITNCSGKKPLEYSYDSISVAFFWELFLSVLFSRDFREIHGPFFWTKFRKIGAFEASNSLDSTAGRFRRLS